MEKKRLTIDEAISHSLGHITECQKEHVRLVAIWLAELKEYRAKLAAYEDTGLSPEVCRNYKLFEDEAISKGVTFDRIVELMNADSQGRLVVLESVNGWISVENRLPLFGEKVIVVAKGKIDGFIGKTVTAITTYTGDKIFASWNEPWSYFLTDYAITHWQPLPPPPTPRQEKTE